MHLKPRENAGFTLVELLIGVVVTSILFLAAGQSLLNNKIAEMSTMAYKDFVELKALVSKLVIDETNCATLFRGDPTAPGYVAPPALFTAGVPAITALTQLTTRVPGGGFQVFLDLGAAPPINTFAGLTVTGINVVPIQLVPTASADLRYSWYLSAEVRFTATKNGITAGALATPIGVGVTFRLDNLGNIVSCSGANPDSIQGVPIPVCIPGSALIFDGVLKQWTCANI